MKAMKQIGRDIILAGLGSMDEQNEEVKELLRRGGVVLGMTDVDNEELCYNGNRERIEKVREEQRTEHETIKIAPGVELNVERKHDEKGKTLERSIELVKNAIPKVGIFSAGISTEDEDES